MPAISVLMPAYNGEKHVARAIESIRSQTCSDWELIIVDDGSTDATSTIVSRAAERDQRIRVVRNEVNRGLAASLNAAFAASTGTLIARMDADDVALPMRLEAQRDFMREHPCVDVLGSAAWEIDARGVRRGITSRRLKHEDIVAHIYKENPFVHPTVMFRRAFFEALRGYDESFRRAQDHDLWLRGYRRFRYHNLPEPLLEYRRPPGLTWRGCLGASRAVLLAARRDGAHLRGCYFAARLMFAFAVSSLRRRAA